MAAPVADWLRRCAAARAEGQPIPEAELFRRMLDHAEWLCDGAADDPIGGPAPNGRAAHVYCGGGAASNGGAGLRQVDGLRLAALLRADVDQLLLHFDADAAPLACDAAEAAHFRSFLRVRVVEALLERLHDGEDLQVDEPFARLRGFDSFYALCAGQPDDGAPLRMALAPDEGGRALAAAFTAQDALKLFVMAREGGGSADLVSVRLTGTELFEQVARSADRLDGLVFNPSGPGRPIPFARGVADAVLGG